MEHTHTHTDTPTHTQFYIYRCVQTAQNENHFVLLDFNASLIISQVSDNLGTYYEQRNLVVNIQI